MTGKLPNVLPKPVAPRLIYTLAFLVPESKPCSLIEGALPLKTYLVKLLQSLKAAYPMLVTLSGIVTLVRLLQSLKAEPLMLVTLSGIVTLVRLLQL
jgi:hypothetical protein